MNLRSRPVPKTLGLFALLTAPLFWAAWVKLGLPPLAAWLAAVNLAVFPLWWLDKRQAKKDARKVKEEGEDVFKRWKLMNNNLGNHLQNRLYLKRDKRECRLSVADMYFTIYNGKGKEGGSAFKHLSCLP